MKNNKKEKSNKSKYVFFSILVICLTIIFALVFLKIFYCGEKIEEKYEFEVVNLDDTNEIYYDVVDYMCSDNVVVSRYENDNFLYISTWERGNPPHSKGVCLLKRINGEYNEK